MWQENRKCEKFKWENKRFRNTIRRKSNMWKSNDKIRDSGILSKENWKFKNSNGKIRDSRILFQENWKCENSNEKRRDSRTLSQENWEF